MHVLILVQSYPSATDPYHQAYVHARVLYYLQQGWTIDVLSFACRQAYVHEGVTVWPETFLQERKTVYDVWISHAPNLRNHLRLILRFPQQWKRLVWVIHGHEVLIKQKYYPAPYPWDDRVAWYHPLLHDMYDHLKVRILKICLRNWLQQQRIQLIFVSEWMRTAFLDCVSLEPHWLAQQSSVIPNPVHPLFLASFWTKPVQPRADFVTIRPLDEPKYAVDIVYALALKNPELRFDVYGKGRFFSHYPSLPNLNWYDRFCVQEELPELLSQYSAALMPTRLDAQGVMVCEMASLGMPVLTSDLPICREMLSQFPRVDFLPEQGFVDLQAFLARLLPPAGDRSIFAPESTVFHEISLIRRAVKPES